MYDVHDLYGSTDIDTHVCIYIRMYFILLGNKTLVAFKKQPFLARCQQCHAALTAEVLPAVDSQRGVLQPRRTGLQIPCTLHWQRRMDCLHASHFGCLQRRCDRLCTVRRGRSEWRSNCRHSSWGSGRGDDCGPLLMGDVEARGEVHTSRES
jgi:hypothetical protein